MGGLVRDLHGLTIGPEPELGPRQASLVDAIDQRLAFGPPLSDADMKAAQMVAEILRLREPAAP